MDQVCGATPAPNQDSVRPGDNPARQMSLNLRPHRPRGRVHPRGRHLRPLGVRGQRRCRSFRRPLVPDCRNRFQPFRTLLRRTRSKSSQGRIRLRLQLRHCR